MLGRSDWRSMGSHRAAFPGMFAEDLAPDRHNIKHAKLKWQHIHPIILLYGCLLTQHCSKSLTEDVTALPIPHPVDGAGGVKSKCLTSLILWSYGNIFFCSRKI